MSSVHEDLSRISYIPRLFGMSPLVFDGQGLFLSKPLLFLTVFCHCVISFARIYIVISGGIEKEEGSFGGLEGILAFWILIPVRNLCMIMGNFASVYALCQVTLLGRFQKKVAIVDLYLKKFGANAVFMKGTTYAIIPIVTVFATFLMRAFVRQHERDVLIAVFISYVSIFYLSLHIYQFRGFLAVLSCRMFVLVKVLRRSSGRRMLEDLVKCHCLLTRSAEYLGFALSPFFLSIATAGFFVFLGDLFSAYMLAAGRSPSFTIIMLRLMWVGYIAIMLHSVLSQVVQITDLAKEFNTILYEMMVDDSTSTISTNKKLRLHISMKREVVFTACGFFNLDYTLVHAIIAASTTNLVMLIQFGS